MAKHYKWIEEYSCGCSTVERTKRELPGYCPNHGNTRLRPPEKILDQSDKLKTGTAR